jgi:aminopeptidase N
MENWGLITYRYVLRCHHVTTEPLGTSADFHLLSTTALLFDEGQSDQKYKNKVAYVVAHELAHQWFGNLVTMDWWNEVRFSNEELLPPENLTRV